MRKILSLLIIALFVAAGFAQTYTMKAKLDSSYKNIDITNCKSPTGGPTMYEVSVDVDNTMPVQMKVSYQYLDFATNSYVDQPQTNYCFVPPTGTRSCKFIIPIRLGNRENGSISNAELLHLTGVDPEGGRPETYTTSFSFNINHQQSLEERNILNKIKEAEGFVSQVSTKIPCSGLVCCGMGGSADKIDQAKLAMANSEEQLKLCNMTSAYSFASSAYANAKGAVSVISTSTDSCEETLKSYKTAKDAVDSAEQSMNGMGCTVDSESKSQLAKAKELLTSAATSIGADDYESANLDIAEAKKSATSAKTTAKCTTSKPPEDGQTPANGTDTGTETGQNGGTTGTGKEPPLCPLGMVLLAFVGLGAFAYSKR